MTPPPKYMPILNENQWKEIISTCNDKQINFLKLFSDNYGQVTQDLAEKELQLPWREIYLNVLGGITKRITNITGISPGNQHWFIAIREGNGKIKWIIHDYSIVKKIFNKNEK